MNSTNFVRALACVGALSGAFAAFADVCRVSAEGAGAKDGSSWANARPLADAWAELADDAKLATTRREMMALLADDITETFPTATTRISFRAEAADWAWNGHLRGASGYDDETTGTWRHYRGHSPAIDAGDPAYDFSREPEPNGRRINLGAYGGTPWATRSGPGLLILVR